MRKSIFMIVVLIAFLVSFSGELFSQKKNSAKILTPKEIYTRIRKDCIKLKAQKDSVEKAYDDNRNKYFPVVILATIRDRDGTTLSLWGDATAQNSENINKEGGYIKQGNIIILNAQQKNIYGDKYTSQGIRYVGKKYGKTVLGATVPIYIYDEDILNNIYEKCPEIIYQLENKINIYDSILVHGSTYSWATKYQFIKNYYDNPILVGIGEYFIKINSWGRFEKGFSGKYGFVDSMGRIIIPMTFDFAEPFKEGLAIVKIQDKYGFINQQGEIVIPAKYDEAESFCEGFAVVCIGKWVTEIDDRKYGFINKKGQEVIPIQFKYASSFSKGFGGVLQNDTLFPVDTSGRINYNSTKK